MMKILVTGGAGFIASHIIDQYVKEANIIELDVLVGQLMFLKMTYPKTKKGLF